MDAEIERGTELKGGFDAANKLYDEESQYFKPEINIEYRLTFSQWRLLSLGGWWPCEQLLKYHQILL